MGFFRISRISRLPDPLRELALSLDSLLGSSGLSPRNSPGTLEMSCPRWNVLVKKFLIGQIFSTSLTSPSSAKML